MITTDVGTIQLEGERVAELTCEYHLKYKEHTSKQDTSGFNLDYSGNRGIFKKLWFRQNSSYEYQTLDQSGSDSSGVLFKTQMDSANLLALLEDRNYFFHNTSSDVDSNNGILRNTRNAFITKDLKTEDDSGNISFGTAGLHVVSDAIFGTPMATAAIENDAKIEKTINTEYAKDLAKFLDCSENLHNLNGAQVVTTSNNYFADACGTTHFEHWDSESSQHLALSYLYQQIVASNPERFLQTYWRDGSGANNGTNSIDQRDTSGNKQFDTLMHWEDIPLERGDTIVMFMRPQIEDMTKIKYVGDSFILDSNKSSNLFGDVSSNNDYSGSEGLVDTTVYNNARQYLVIHDDMSSNNTPSSIINPSQNDTDGLIMAIEFTVTQTPPRKYHPENSHDLPVEYNN